MRPPAPCWQWRFFPLSKCSAIPVAKVKAWLVHLFAVWGRPKRVRVDNGWPWGSGQDLPPVLSLWLVGLGVEVVWNRPAHPQQNGIVERFNGLLDQWGEPESCPGWPEWVTSVERVVRVQRELYPAVEGKSRIAAYPELLQNPRRSTERVERNFSIQAVHQFLAEGFWKRSVNKQGQITLYHRPFCVGSQWAGRTVFVRLDPKSCEWVVRDQQGNELKRHAATELRADRIQALDVSYVKPSERATREQRPNPAASYVT